MGTSKARMVIDLGKTVRFDGLSWDKIELEWSAPGAEPVARLVNPTGRKELPLRGVYCDNCVVVDPEQAIFPIEEIEVEGSAMSEPEGIDDFNPPATRMTAECTVCSAPATIFRHGRSLCVACDELEQGEGVPDED